MDSLISLGLNITTAGVIVTGFAVGWVACAIGSAMRFFVSSMGGEVRGDSGL